MKRFYKSVSVGADDAGYRVLLDGRAVKTVGGRPQVVRSKALAETLAGEWAGQGETIDPTSLVMRDMTDFAIDVVIPDPASLIATLACFAETDTLCYRAEPDEALGTRQQDVWEPLVLAAEARHGVRFHRIAGIVHRAQPAETLATLRAHVAGLDPFTLAALNATTSLSASLLVGLAALAPGADLGTLWTAANLEEDWQAELWGKDAEAEERRARRYASFAAAARFAALARPGPGDFAVQPGAISSD